MASYLLIQRVRGCCVIAAPRWVRLGVVPGDARQTGDRLRMTRTAAIVRSGPAWSDLISGTLYGRRAVAGLPSARWPFRRDPASAAALGRHAAARRWSAGRRSCAVLGAAWSEVLRGCRQVVVVGGEPGAGKSRLLAEQCAVLHGRRGARARRHLRGRSRAAVPALRRAGRGAARRPREAATAELLGWWPARTGLARDAPQGPEHRRALYDSVAVAVRELSAEQPVVLALEDLHWAGPPALRAAHVPRRAHRRHAVLVLATHRTTAPDASRRDPRGVAPLPARRGPAARPRRAAHRGHRRLPLREAGVPLHRARGPAAALRDLTGGNPFFLRELWRDVSARGGPRRAGQVAVRVPAVGAGRAREPAAAACRAAAPDAGAGGGRRRAGRRCDGAVAASDWSRDTTLAGAGRRAWRGACCRRAPARYRFPHALARQAVRGAAAPVAARAPCTPGSARCSSARRTARPRACRSWPTTTSRRRPWATGGGGALPRRGRPLGGAGARPRGRRPLGGAGRGAWSTTRDAAVRCSWAPRGVTCSAGTSRAPGRWPSRSRAARTRSDRLQAAVLYEAASWRPGLPGHRAVGAADGRAARARRTDGPLVVRARASLGRALAFTGDTDAAREVGAAALARARDLGDDRLLAHALQASLWQGLLPEDVPGQAGPGDGAVRARPPHRRPGAARAGRVLPRRHRVRAGRPGRVGAGRRSTSSGSRRAPGRASSSTWPAVWTTAGSSCAASWPRRTAPARPCSSWGRVRQRRHRGADSSADVHAPARERCAGGGPPAHHRRRGAGGALGARACSPSTPSWRWTDPPPGCWAGCCGPELEAAPGLGAVARRPGLPRRGGAAARDRAAAEQLQPELEQYAGPQPGRGAVRGPVRQCRPLPGRARHLLGRSGAEDRLAAALELDQRTGAPAARGADPRRHGRPPPRAGAGREEVEALAAPDPGAGRAAGAGAPAAGHGGAPRVRCPRSARTA